METLERRPVHALNPGVLQHQMLGRVHITKLSLRHRLVDDVHIAEAVGPKRTGPHDGDDLVALHPTDGVQRVVKALVPGVRRLDQNP